MKINGTWLMPALALSRRQVSKPSISGMTASSRIRSGVMRSTMLSAAGPEVAIRTEKPDCSSASVKNPRASGESSTSRTMSRGRADSANRFYLFIVELTQKFQETGQIEGPEIDAQRIGEG